MAVSSFDIAALRAWLLTRLGLTGEPVLEQIEGGQSNPTWFLTLAGKKMVLRKQPPGDILRGAHAIDREFRVLTALHPTNVPVPRPISYCDDTSILGTPFYLMERIEGRVFHDASLPGVAPAQRLAIYLSMAETMAKLHALRPDQIGLGDYGRPGNYFERQVSRWTRQWHASTGYNIPEIDQLGRWLTENLPDDDGQISIAHGDFRLGNLIYHPSEPRVVGILDWELSTLGHPLADLGFCCMTWRTLPSEYGGIRGLEIGELGIPERTRFIEHYYQHAALKGPLLPFHEAFALFRFAVIFVGIADRSKAGNAADDGAGDLAPLARLFAKTGLDLV